MRSNRILQFLAAILVLLVQFSSINPVHATGLTYSSAGVLSPSGRGLNNPTQGAFRDDLLTLSAYRRAECPVYRTNNYYFSTRGSNSTGDGKNGVPFGSLTGGNLSGSTLTFTGSPFTAYTTVTKGDTICLTGGTGVTPGSYLILTRIDANNITIGGRVDKNGTTVIGSVPPTVSDSSITVSGGWYLTTMSKVQTLHDAAGSVADMAFLMKNGETLQETSTKSYSITSSAGTLVSTTVASVNTVTGSRVLYTNTLLTGLLVGSLVSGTGIPAQSYIEALNRDTVTGTYSVTINNPCTATGSITLTQTTYTFTMSSVGTTGDGYTYPSNLPNLGLITLTGGTNEVVRCINAAPGSATNNLIVTPLGGATTLVGGTHTGIQFSNTHIPFLCSKKQITLGAFGANVNGRKFTAKAWVALTSNSCARAYTNSTVTGTAAITGFNWTTVTKSLTKTGAFTGYPTWSTGDTVTVSAGTGVTTGVYTIASRISSDEIRLDTEIHGGTDLSDASISIFGAGKELQYTMTYPAVDYVAGVRNVNSNIPWRQVYSIADVDTRATANDAGKWYQDPATKTLYLSAGAGQGIRTVTGGTAGTGQAYEICYESQFPLIYLTTGSDMIRLDGWETSGYGLNTGLIQTFVGNTYHVKGALNNVDGAGTIQTPTNGGNPQCAVVSDWTATHTYYHSIGILGQYGGCVTYYNVLYGWGSVTADLVTYAAGGRNESLLFYVQCLGCQLPQGMQYNGNYNSGSPNLCHSSLQTITSSNWSGNTITLTNNVTGVNGDNVEAAAFADGRQVKLIRSGGTLTRTIATGGYNAATGVLTFTTNMDGATYTGFESNLYYPVNLYVIYYPRALRGAYQSQNYQCPSNGKIYSDIANCRVFIVGDDYERRDATHADMNYVEMPITSTTRGDKTITLTTPVPTSVMGAANNTQFYLHGGTATGSDATKYSGYVASTGVITLNNAFPVRSSGRTYISFPVTSSTTAQVVATAKLGGGDWVASTTVTAGAGLMDSCYINGKYYLGSLFTQNAGGAATFANAGQIAGSTLINNTIVADSSQTFSSGSGQFALPLANASGFFGRWFNNNIIFRTSPRYLVGIEGTAMASGSVTPTALVFMNNLVVADIDTSATALDTFGGTGSQFALGVGNIAANQKNNAIYNSGVASGTPGYDQDPYVVVGFGVPPVAQFPTTDSILVSPNNQLIDGKTLAYDQNWNLRTSNAIGALDPIVAFPSKKNKGSAPASRRGF